MRETLKRNNVHVSTEWASSKSLHHLFWKRIHYRRIQQDEDWQLDAKNQISDEKNLSIMKIRKWHLYWWSKGETDKISCIFSESILLFNTFYSWSLWMYVYSFYYNCCSVDFNMINWMKIEQLIQYLLLIGLIISGKKLELCSLLFCGLWEECRATALSIRTSPQK